MDSHESDPSGSREKAGFRARAGGFWGRNWKKAIIPAGFVGGIAFGLYTGQDVFSFTANIVNGDETTTGLVINRGTQQGLDQRTSPIKCDYDEACPVDDTSFHQQKRYFVMIENCELVVVDPSTSVQPCDRKTYQTNEDTYNKAVRGTKIEIPDGSRLVAFSSVTK